jgi:glycosyltransferase involved in cell wall biosynthesis
MARVSILTPTLVPSDAVSNDVLGMHDVLTRRGHEVHLFAEDWNVEGFRVNHVWKAPEACERLDDILIYHHSIGWVAGSDVLKNCAAKTVIKYHNVTPPEFFAEISAQHQRLCEVGRAQLAAIARADHTAYLAASEYNLRELLREGADDSRSFVVPPFNQAGSLATVVPDMKILDQYADGRTNLLMVGSLRPNKGHIALIEAFAQYYYDYNCNSRLFIVGAEDESLKAYSTSLRHFAQMLHVEEAIVFTGEVPVEALKSYYLSASVFVIASEHEGFCVPLVEAMAMKLPIVGYASAAVAETVGGCGILWPERDPALIAESINLLIEDEAVSASVSLSAQGRYEDMFANAVIEGQFLRAAAAAGIHF